MNLQNFQIYDIDGSVIFYGGQVRYFKKRSSQGNWKELIQNNGKYLRGKLVNYSNNILDVICNTISDFQNMNTF